MTATHRSSGSSADDGQAQAMAAHFAGFVVQHTNLTLIMLGLAPHPDTGQTIRDFDYARLLIDQLEMLEFKTAGNLSQQESSLLKQSLMTVRMAFVEAMEKPAHQSPPPVATAPSTAEIKQPAPDSSSSIPSSPASKPDDAAGKRFTKSY